ncbi:MAG: sulfotransferase [Alphaproteobacteria bacterium]
MDPRTAPNGGNMDVQSLRQKAVQALTAGRMRDGIGLLEKALQAEPTSGEINADLGTAYWQSGDPARAEGYYARAIKFAPQNPFVLNIYGAFLLEQRQLDRAEPLLRRAFALKPDHYEIPNNLGLLEYRRRNIPEARALFLQVIRLNPSWANAHANLGDVLRDARQPDLAEKAYLHALKLSPGHARAWFRLADLYIDLSREDEAIDCLRRATDIHPADREPWMRLIGLLEVKGRVDEALETVDKARKHIAPQYLAFHEAKLFRRTGKIDEAIALLERHRKTMLEQPPRPMTAAYFFELGQIYDRANDADRAFQSFALANGLQDKVGGSAVVKEQCRKSVAHCMKTFTSKLAEASCEVPSLGDRPGPVFLIGFPRSGTTLLDQILSSHSGVFVAEERDALDKAMWHFVLTFGEEHRAEILKNAKLTGEAPWYLSNPCYPSALDKLRTQDIAEMRRLYYQQHEIGNGEADGKIFIDKMPLNILHVGFIKRIFPDARFILALRHPCDSVLSCFMQEFHLNPYMQRFLDLEDAARFYDEVFRLWDHYKNIMPLDVHTIHYEDVVADFQPTVAALLGFLGLEWTDAVLEYDKTALNRTRRIHTPSYSQVTEKIYTRASGRWLRYRKHMEPVLPILASHTLRHGYSMEDDKGQE